MTVGHWPVIIAPACQYVLAAFQPATFETSSGRHLSQAWNCNSSPVYLGLISLSEVCDAMVTISSDYCYLCGSYQVFDISYRYGR